MKRLLLGCRSSKWGLLLPALYLYQTTGCLPDNAVLQVLGENIVFTFAIVIQTITAEVFNAIFGPIRV